MHVIYVYEKYYLRKIKNIYIASTYYVDNNKNIYA